MQTYENKKILDLKLQTLPDVSKFLPQNCVSYRTKLHGTVLKQPIRIEYLIKQKP